jgi:predicted tellurium resistance membrane protein TerC
MSLDNVLAIAGAAGGHTGLIVLGLIISIPLVVFGATLLTWLLERLPILVWAGAALLGWVAGELIATEPILQSYVQVAADQMGVTIKVVTRSVEVFGAGLVVAVGWLITKASARKTAKEGAH